MRNVALAITLLLVTAGNAFACTGTVDEYTVETFDSPLGRLRCQTGPDVYEKDKVRIFRSNFGESIVPGADQVVAKVAEKLILEGLKRIFVVDKDTDEEDKCLLKEAWPERAIFLTASGEEIPLAKLCPGD